MREILSQAGSYSTRKDPSTIAVLSFCDPVRDGMVHTTQAMPTQLNISLKEKHELQMRGLRLVVVISSRSGYQYQLATHITVLSHLAYRRGGLPRPSSENQFQGWLPAQMLSAVIQSELWLPSVATGVTTGTLEVRPLRSSRTRSSSLQFSNTHGRQGPNCLATF